MAMDRKLFKVTTSIGTISLFSLAIPMIIECVMNNLLGTVSTIVLSGYSQNAVTAVGSSNSLISMFSILMSVVYTGVSVVISNFIGAEDLRKARESVLIALVMCVFISVCCSVILVNCRYQLMDFMNLSGSVAEDAARYFQIRITFLVIPTISSLLSSVLRCYGYASATVIVGLTANVCNLLLSIFVIHFAQYSPVTGVTGVATACVVSQLIALIIVTMLFFKFKMKMQAPPNMEEALDIAGRILKIGIPTGLSSSSFTISQTIITSFVALMGMHMVNAKVYFSSILCYVYLFSMNVGNANSILVGRLYGAGRVEQADRANRQLVKITVTVNMIISLVVFALRKPLMSMFTDDPEIIQLTFAIMLIDIIVEQARAVSQVYEYALRATGDVLFTVAILVVSCWCCSIGLAYILGIKCGMGLVGCWIGLAIDESIRAITTYFRWQVKRGIPARKGQL